MNGTAAASAPGKRNGGQAGSLLICDTLFHAGTPDTRRNRKKIAIRTGHHTHLAYPVQS